MALFGSRSGAVQDGRMGAGAPSSAPIAGGVQRTYKGVSYTYVKGRPQGPYMPSRTRGADGGSTPAVPDSWIFEGKAYKNEGDVFSIVDGRIQAAADATAASATSDLAAKKALVEAIRQDVIAYHQAVVSDPAFDKAWRYLGALQGDPGVVGFSAGFSDVAAAQAAADKSKALILAWKNSIIQKAAEKAAAEAAAQSAAGAAAQAAQAASAQAEADRIAREKAIAQAEADRLARADAAAKAAAQAEADRIAREKADADARATQAIANARSELASIVVPSKPSGPRVDALMSQIQTERSALQTKLDAGTIPDFSFLRGKVAALDAAAADDEAERQANTITTRQGSYKGVPYVLTIRGGAAVQSVDAGKYGTFPTEGAAQSAIDQAQSAEAETAAKAKRIQDIAGRIQTLAAQASGIQGGAKVSAAKQTFAAEQGRLRDLLANGQEPSLDTLQAALDAISSAKDAEAGDQAAAAAAAATRQSISDQADQALQAIAATPQGDDVTEQARTRVKSEVAAIKSALASSPTATPSTASLASLVAAVASAYAAYQGKQALATAEASRKQQEDALRQAARENDVALKSQEASALAQAAAKIPQGDDKVEQSRAALVQELNAVQASLANKDLTAAAGTSMGRARSLLSDLQDAFTSYKDRSQQSAVQAEQQAAKAAAIASRKDEVSQIVAQASAVPRGDDPVEAARGRVLTEAEALTSTLASGSDASTTALRSLLSDLRSVAQSYQVRMKEQEGDAAARQQASAARIDAANQAIKARREQQAQSALNTIAVMERMAASVPKGTPAIEQARSQFAAEAAALKAKAAAGEVVDTTFLESRLSALTGRSGGLLAWLLSLLKA